MDNLVVKMCKVKSKFLCKTDLCYFMNQFYNK